MPGRGRGKRRGGGYGSRGGNKGSGRFRINNSKKKKSKGHSNNHRQPPPPPKDGFPELIDLSGNVYIPEYGTSVPKSNMKNLARRNRSMMSEALYTDSHMDETLNLPMRKRPIEFVKAKETYDPSKELTKKLENVLLQDKDITVKEVKPIESDGEVEEIEEDEKDEEEEKRKR